MANITSALAGLVSFGATVAGITNGGSYDIKTYFDALAAGTLVAPPVLLAMLNLQDQGDWMTLAMLGNAPQVKFKLQHYLLVAAVGGTEDFTYQHPAIVIMLDAYMAALKALPFFTPTSAPSIHLPTQCVPHLTRSKWGETQFHSILFDHDVMLNL
jgi:hypothetical protein